MSYILHMTEFIDMRQGFQKYSDMRQGLFTSL